METLAMANNNGIFSATAVVGPDFGLGTPSEEFINANVYFLYGDSIGHLFNALIHTGRELRIGKRKITRARGLQLWIFGLGNEESVRDSFLRHF